MRYFLYISDSKVDMLLPQLPTKKPKKVSAEYGFSLKALKGNIKTERETKPPEDRIQRLVAVEKHIRAHEPVGTIFHPEKWIEGKGLALTTTIKGGDGAIFFFMRQGGRYLALGGSAFHLIGNVQTKQSRPSWSFAPRLIESLLGLDYASQALQDDSEQFASGWINRGVGMDPHPWAGIIYYNCHQRQNRSFTTPISFLARKLDVAMYQEHTTILATPLFVEQIGI